MKNSLRYSVFGLLLLSAIMLSLLVPGGPIETRDFSHINPLVLGSFNIFLTTLSLSSFLLLYFVWKRQAWAFWASAINGLAYCLVYVLDLAHWFPVSPDAMPPALLVIEVLGAIVSIPLIVLSVHGISASTISDGSKRSNATQPKNYPSDVLMMNTTGIVGREKVGIVLVVAIAVGMGMGIVIFATRSAMGV